MNRRISRCCLGLGLACLPAASLAQTDDEVTLYGRVFVMVESVEARGETVSVPRRTRLTEQGAALGIRGRHAMGPDLTTFFQLETSFFPDQNGPFANRNSGVGLRGSWGSVVVGRWDAPFKLATANVDAFTDLTIAGLAAALNGSGIVGVPAVFDRRDLNVVQYWSPRLAGFAVRLSATANEGKTATLNPRNQGASVIYEEGPVYVGYAFDEVRDALGLTGPRKQTGHALAGRVDVRDWRFGAIYEQLRRDGHSTQTAWLANVVWTLGRSQWIYQYQRSAKGRSLRATSMLEPRCDVHSVGYKYNFSRLTFFLVEYASVKNSPASICNFGNNPLAITAGQDPRGFAAGIRQNF